MILLAIVLAFFLGMFGTLGLVVGWGSEPRRPE